MPTYDYRCQRCGHRFEVFHGIKDETPRHCPECGGPAKRVPSGGAGLLFKGSGFYITDYRSKAYKEKARQEKSGGSSDKGGSSGDKGGSSGDKGGSSGDKGGSGGSAKSGG